MSNNLKKSESEEKKELDLEHLKDLLSKDKLPTDLGELILSKLSKDLKKIAEFRKKKQEVHSEEELKSLIENTYLSEEEIERQIALHDLVLEHKETFLKILEPAKRSEKIRASGHYWDNKLKYHHPAKNKDQLTIFDLLEKPETKQKIEKVDYEVSAIGITLTPGENKLMTALIKLLHDKSENQDRESEKFYSGNYRPLQLIPNYGGTGEEIRAPVLKIKPAELYKAYLDDNEYSGKEIKIIKNLIDSLASKKFIIRYMRRKIVEKNGKKERLTDLIEDFQPLIRIIRYTPDLTDAELDSFNKNGHVAVEKKGEYIIGLNPVIIDQISTKYIEFPRDIEKRTADAAGGPMKVSESDVSLRDYMLRELSNKRYQCEINEDKLPYILKLDKYIEHRRKKMIQQKVDKAIQVCKNLDLLKSVEIELGKKGQSKFIFHLNPNFG